MIIFTVTVIPGKVQTNLDAWLDRRGPRDVLGVRVEHDKVLARDQARQICEVVHGVEP